MARDGIDGAKINDCGVDGTTDGHDRHPSHEIRLSPFDVVIHDGAAAIILGVIPSDRHRGLVAIQHSDRTAGFALGGKTKILTVI